LEEAEKSDLIDQEFVKAVEEVSILFVCFYLIHYKE